MMRFLSLLLASASAEGADAATASMSLLSKGLLVTAAGLAGVFLVLLLFFLTIKLMQKFNK